jgi:hypothetical protein
VRARVSSLQLQPCMHVRAGKAVPRSRQRRRRRGRDPQDGRPSAGRPVRRRAAPEHGVGGQALRPRLPAPAPTDERGTTTLLLRPSPLLPQYLHQSLVCMAGGMYRVYVIKSSNRLATMQCNTYRWCRYWQERGRIYVAAGGLTGPTSCCRRRTATTTATRRLGTWMI